MAFTAAASPFFLIVVRRWGVRVQHPGVQDLVWDYYNTNAQDTSAEPDAGGLAIDLARLLIRHQSHIGGELRSLPGREWKGDAWPRQDVNADWWAWRPVISFAWDDSETMNVLEARAVLQTLRWRARSHRFVGSRCIHLVDSQVVLGDRKSVV